MTPRQRIERLRGTLLPPGPNEDVRVIFELLDEWEQKWRLVARYASQTDATIALSADALALLDKESP